MGETGSLSLPENLCLAGKSATRCRRTGAAVAALKKLAAPKGLEVLPVGEAFDQNAFAQNGFAVSVEFAKKYNLKTLWDLRSRA